jgi:hypothetical protein
VLNIIILKPLHGTQILTSVMRKTGVWDIGQMLCIKKCVYKDENHVYYIKDSKRCNVS